MSAYIPAIKIVDRHFKTTEYKTSYSATALESYQEALTQATKDALREDKEPPITRMDGFEYPKPQYIPVVLKEVVMVESDLPPSPNREEPHE